MSETNTVKKPKPTDNSNNSYVKTFRHGAIAANVFCRTAPVDWSTSTSVFLVRGKQAPTRKGIPRGSLPRIVMP